MNHLMLRRRVLWAGKSGFPLSDFPVGTLIRMNVAGAARNFLTVHQGLPSSMYDASCDGTWLLMNDIYENRVWDSSRENKYKDSNIHSYLNSTFLGLFDSNVQSLIKQIKIPYASGGSSSSVLSGANGLDAKIFLLSGYEVGFTNSISSSIKVDGSKLDYFISGTGSDANTKRIANLNNSGTNWYLRSPYGTKSFVLYVASTGAYGNQACTSSYGIRPALIIPSDAMVSATPNADGSYTLVA